MPQVSLLRAKFTEIILQSVVFLYVGLLSNDGLHKCTPIVKRSILPICSFALSSLERQSVDILVAGRRNPDFVAYFCLSASAHRIILPASGNEFTQAGSQTPVCRLTFSREHRRPGKNYST